MKTHTKTIEKVCSYLTKKHKVSAQAFTDENFNDFDIKVFSMKKPPSTYTVKWNNTYNNDKVVVETQKFNAESRRYDPSGLSVVNSDYTVLVFDNTPKMYIIETSKLLRYAATNLYTNEVGMYNTSDRNGCRISLLDRTELIKQCKKI